MLEKLLAKLEAFLNGCFVPKANLETATAKIAELSDKITSLEATAIEVATARASESNLLAAATEKVTALISERDTLKSEVDRLKAEAITVDESASAKAREICAAQGIPAGRLPNQEDSKILSAAAELDKVRAQIREEKDPLKRSALAVKARELRGHGNLFK